MRILARPVSVLALFVVSACATGLPSAKPSDIPAIQQRLNAAPNDAEARTRLGIALYKDGQYPKAVDALKQAVSDGAQGGAASLYLGLSYEKMEDWSDAQDAYQAFLDAGASGPLVDDIRGRLALMGRRVLQEAAKQALSQEAQLSQEPPAPRSVAVFPFRLISDNEELQPLQVALADMMITDLSLAGDLTVLERTQIQSLLDEMALTQAGYTEPSTGARAGRLLRAAHVVQGALTTLGQGGIRFDADVLDTEQGQSSGEVTDQNQIQSIFDLEKQVVFQVLDVLGVDITAAEREAINENRAENLLAFLAYGRGLQAMDRGDYSQASRFFQQSVQLDPGYQPAQEHRDEINSIADAASTPPDQVPQEGAGLAPIPEPENPVGGDEVSSTLTDVGEAVNPTPTSGTIDLGDSQGGGSEGDQQQGQQRDDPVQESTGQEKPSGSQSATIRVTIPRPGGEL